MCVRYFVEKAPETETLVELMNRSPLAERFRERGAVRSFGEIRPTDVSAAVATSRGGARSVFPMKWGFSGRSLLVNARTETASEKPAFREAWRSHRCVIPASWYFEWEHLTDEAGKRKTGSKYRLRPAASGLAWLAGLYRLEEGLPCYVVLTREPGESIRFIHDRMPLLLPEEAAEEWIRPQANPEEIIRFALTDPAYEPAV